MAPSGTETPGREADLRLMVEAAGVEPASESDPPEASTCLASSEVLSPPSPGRSRRLGGQPSSSRLPSERGRGRPAGYSASSRPATGGADPRTSLLVRQREQADCCQLSFSSRFNEDDWFLGMQPGLQHSRRARFAPTELPLRCAHNLASQPHMVHRRVHVANRRDGGRLKE